MRYAILGSFLLFSALSAGASERAVDVKVSAAFINAPGNVTVKAIVVPDDRNQLLTISAESADYLRRSTVQLAGKDEARVHELSLVSLPEGDYVVSARLVGRDGSSERAETTLRVYGGTRRPKG